MVRPLPVWSCALVWCLFPGVISYAAEQQFPYQAVVVGEQVEVRCGPGTHFYVTSLAKQNDQVTVHRHDHGGWYMIAPPQGSFSWIEAALVQRAGSNRGVVTITPENGQTPRAIVRIGSLTGDQHSYYGRELSNGDEVTILGEKTLSGPQGDVPMLKIVPPAQEFRWIKGEFLVPVSRQIQQQLAIDPYQIPAEHRQRLVEQGLVPLPAGNADEKTNVSSKPATPAPALPAPEAETALEFDRLDEIDQRYAEMMNQPPAQWRLETIEEAYRELKTQTSPRMIPVIDQRLEVVSKRREIARHYQNFIQVTGETTRRDAQLLTQRADYQVAMPQAGSDQVSSGNMIAPPQLMPLPVSSVEAGSAAPADPTAPAASPKLCGAGVLHHTQAPPELPQFVLVAPDGRLLAYVEPLENVRMEEWVEKPAGLIGERAFDATLQADRIRVRSIVPVQLRR